MPIVFFILHSGYYKEYCHREGLVYRQDRTRTYGYSDESRKKKPVDLVDSVDKSGESGIIKEDSKKPITVITDKSVNNVSKVRIPGYTDEECDFIYQQHKSLLECARDNNGCNEVAFVFSGGLSVENRKTFFGSDDMIDFGQELYGNSIVMMHNHPRNSSYSFSDIVEFIGNDSIKTMTIVKNNGGVEILTKTGLFNKLDLLKELNTKEKRMLRNDNSSRPKDDKYRKLVDKFIIGYEQEGVLKWIR